MKTGWALALSIVLMVLGGCNKPVCDSALCDTDAGAGGGSGGGTAGGSGGGTAGGSGGGTAGGSGGGTAGGSGGGTAGGAGGGAATCATACTGDTFCDPATLTCVHCTATMGCSGTTPICDLSVLTGQCVGCVTGLTCSPSNLCDPMTHQCVGCFVNGDCQNPTPLCNAAKKCVGCTSTAQCANGATCSPSGACEPAPETCATAQALALPAIGTTTVLDVDVAGATDDAQGSCNPGGGAELVYKLSLPATSSVTVTAARPAGSLANPVLYLRGSPCGSSAEVACSNEPSPSAPESVSLTNQPAGDYFLFVEGVGANVGPIHLTVAVTPPNDACVGAKPLQFVGGIATTTGNTTSASNSNLSSDDSPSCSPSASDSGKDLVYSYTLTAAQDVTISAIATGAGATFKPVVYLRKPGACQSAASADELGCDSSGTSPQGTPATISVLNQQPGTYFLFVDGAQDTAGAFALDVTLAAPTLPPANDSCAGATSLSFVGSIATATGNTTQATNGNVGSDVPSCSSTAGSSGKDVVYSYTLTAARDVELTATPKASSPTFSPVIYVLKPNACASSLEADELACNSTASSSAGTAAKVVLLNQQPGTYFLVVDGALDSVGGFTLDAVLSPPTLPPGNDTCATPRSLTIGAVAVAGTNVGANNDYSRNSTPAYSSACDTFSWNGRDVVYKVTPTVSGMLQARVTPSANFDPGILVMTGTCSPSACVDYHDSAYTGSVETLDFAVTAGQTYFVVVDHWGGSSTSDVGTFTIEVH